MRKKKILILMLIMLFIGGSDIFAFRIWVTDWVNFAERIVIWGEELLKWKDQFDQFKEYKDQFTKLKNKFTETYAAFKNLDSLKDLFVDVGNLEILINVIYNDPQKMESWFKIYTGNETILGKYPNITNNEFVRNTEIYKRSPIVQKQIEQQIADTKKEIDNMQNIANILGKYRKTEKEMLGEIRKIQDQVKEFSLEKKENNEYTSGELFKVVVANASIRLQGMISEVNTVSMIRMMMENIIRERTIEIDEILRKAREDAAAFEANTKK